EQVGLADDMGSTNNILIPLVKMDNPDITMEEYIELEAYKAHRRDFPTIIFNDPLATDHKISSEPTVSPLDDNEIDFKISFDESYDEDYTVIYDKNSFSYKLIFANDLNLDSKNDDNKVNISSNDVVVEQSDSGIDANVDTQYHEFDEENHDTPVMLAFRPAFTTHNLALKHNMEDRTEKIPREFIVLILLILCP
ncbi:hypothetical protein Tco_0357325, partial [Tanacetum coccineum]